MRDTDKIKAKIRALREKTVAAGCTEEEALAAAEVAARIMAEAGLSDTDVEMTAERARETKSRATWRAHISASVAHVTSTAAILLPDSQEIEFVGRAPGPEVAAYLYAVLTGAVLREQSRFKATDEYCRRRTTRTRRAALADFAFGMVLRLRRRLWDLFASSLNADARAAARQALLVRHTDTEKFSWAPKKPRFQSATTAGYQAGGKVTLAHGVARGADGQPLAIGGRK